MEIPVLEELAVVFALAVGVLLVCHRLRVPSILGFLLTGVVAGPYGLGLVSAVHEVEVMAEIGVVLLLFTIGLELSPGEILKLGRQALGGGTGQVGLTLAGVALIAWLVGLPVGQAVFVGCLVALSSTAIVLRLFQDRAGTESPAGRTSLAILLFQDLAVVPMILLAPLLAGRAPHASLRPIVVGIVAVGGILLLGRVLLPIVLHAVARTRSREAFLLATLVLCLGVALVTSQVGLSLALGAFLAGLLLAGSPYSLSALQGVLPFRDVFTSLFFVSVGMLLDARILVDQPILVLGGTLAVIAGKALVATVVVLALGVPLKPALLAGLSLGQIGEFAFVLARSGLEFDLLDADRYQLFLAISVATMMATPLCVAAAPWIADRLSRLPLPRRLLGAGEAPVAGQQEPVHLVIVGYGLGGRHLARAAQQAGIGYRVIEMNPVTVREEAARGEPLVYGDATLPAVLEHAGVVEARVLAVVVSDPVAIRRITEVARRVNPALHLVVRTRFVTEVEPLRTLGADDVVAEEFETSVEVFTRVLAHCLVPHEEIERFTEGIRSEGYMALRSTEPAVASVRALALHLPDLDVVGLTVSPGSRLDGQTLAGADLRRSHGLTVLAVRRGKHLTAGPDGSWRLEPEDVAWVFGDRPAVAASLDLFREPARVATEEL
ncbi:MAG: cation:proton antiporter [Deltaproteobacteria bacterium]|nr:cation:proton antiporter [Deltaproteobacteria bacterium]